eukprot:m.75736 g.75736  ORF g.75736 m.75736 type:complete len:66 (-) comp8492_c2_seq1:24-221(-)
MMSVVDIAVVGEAVDIAVDIVVVAVGEVVVGTAVDIVVVVVKEMVVDIDVVQEADVDKTELKVGS